MTNNIGAPDTIRTRLNESAAIKQMMAEDATIVATIGTIADTIVDAYRSGKKVLLCGNGGSASDAQHIAAEFVGRFQAERGSLAAISLAANTSTVTAIANDYSFEETFSRQVNGLGQRGDILIGLSTSGNSENVVRAVRVANENGLTTVAFSGNGGGRLLEIADLSLQIPDENTARIQEAHTTAAHIVCELVEVELFGERT